MLGKLFSSGAADLVKNVGGVIDSLHTYKEEKLEDAQKKAEEIRKELFNNYIVDGKKNWEKNKSHFKGSYIASDMTICSKLTEEK